MKVVHCKDEHYDVYIGRPSKWGNPFSHLNNTLAKFKVKDRKEAVEKYKEWIITQPELLKDLNKLDGKILGCWCKPQLCHGDVLIDLINAEKTK